MFHTTNYFTDERFILVRQYDALTRGTLAVQGYPNVKTPRDVPKWTATTTAERLPFPWSVAPAPLASELWS